MTRNWPMQPTTNETTDMFITRDSGYAHCSVNGVDCWSEQKAFGKTVHEKFLELGKDFIRERCKLGRPRSQPLCSDERISGSKRKPMCAWWISRSR